MIVCPQCGGEAERSPGCPLCDGRGGITLDAYQRWYDGDVPAPPKRHTTREQHGDECRALMDLVRMHIGRYPCLRWFHRIENRHRDKATAGSLKAEGSLRGVPDYFLPWPSAMHAGLYLEMKVGADRASHEQREFLEAVSAAGFRAVIAYGATQAWAALEAYCIEAGGVTLASPNVETWR